MAGPLMKSIINEIDQIETRNNKKKTPPEVSFLG